MGCSLRGLKVLVIEDEYLIASLIEELLESAGCTVLGPIPRLSDALAAARSETCTAAVLDVNLAGQFVYPVAEILDQRKVPFVFMTGYGRGGLPQEYVDRPIIGKPFKNDELISALSQLIKPLVG
jgi:CheY-like chemotaxis protein